MAPCTGPEEYIILVMRVSIKQLRKQIKQHSDCMITDFNGV